MADDPPLRRILFIWYDDTTNRVEMDADDFSWLEVPTLLRAALDLAEANLPEYDTEEIDTDE